MTSGKNTILVWFSSPWRTLPYPWRTLLLMEVTRTVVGHWCRYWWVLPNLRRSRLCIEGFCCLSSWWSVFTDIFKWACDEGFLWVTGWGRIIIIPPLVVNCNVCSTFPLHSLFFRKWNITEMNKKHTIPNTYAHTHIGLPNWMVAHQHLCRRQVEPYFFISSAV